MTAPRSVKASSFLPQSVGVVFSKADLTCALRLRKPPDFFELRLDGLGAVIGELPSAIAKLRAPIIVTARSRAEGGANDLPVARRRELLLRFLANAACVDVELRSATALAAVLDLARAQKIRVILSLHDLETTPKSNALSAAARRAFSLGADIFKIATRTDRPAQLDRLLEFITSSPVPIPVSAMGIGKLGHVSRPRLAQAGSVLNYAHVGRPTVEGQWSLAELRAALPSR